MKSTAKRGRAGRGYIVIDVVAALVVVGSLAAALATSRGRYHSAAQKSAATRAALQIAERVLTDLQAGRPSALRPLEPDPDVRIETRPVAAESPAPAPGQRWAEVVVSVRGGRASLVGVVPEGGQ